MVYKEKEFIKYKGVNKGIKNELRKNFQEAQNLFDKELRRAARKYNREVIDNIESVCNENPREFWSHIKKLGPRSNLDIPMKIKEGGNFITDESTVLKRWRDDFDNLLTEVAVKFEKHSSFGQVTWHQH